ncbi:MAG: hypothetical protein RIS35_456 [Pseudomonadota bacterium]|jgi:uncharacterized protein with HEPN domain
MQREDIVRLTHMRDAAASALRFVQGRTRDDLDRDQMLLFALVRAVEIIGEAATKVSPDGQDALPDIRWRAITGMRNRLVHAYFDVDRGILWETLQSEMPGLKARLSAVLDAFDKGSGDQDGSADS